VSALPWTGALVTHLSTVRIFTRRLYPDAAASLAGCPVPCCAVSSSGCVAAESPALVPSHSYLAKNLYRNSAEKICPRLSAAQCGHAAVLSRVSAVLSRTQPCCAALSRAESC
jgi:hypothetical protein